MVGSADRSAAPRVERELLGSRLCIGPWLLDEVGRIVADTAPASTIAVITDDNVGVVAAPNVIASLRHFAPHSRVILHSVPAGEMSKTRDTWTRLTDWMLTERCGRDTTIVALGGGVVTDLAGFVAATFMRGVPVVQVPTTLLAMVDASIGGKTGVDTPLGKNLVGAFHQPAAVVIDPTVLRTLGAAERRGGLAEILKHGIIADASYVEQCLSLGSAVAADNTDAAISWHAPEVSVLILRSVEIKADVVRRDEREAGLRHVLNYGHTVAHALEAQANFGLAHGEAVAIGMLVEARLAELTGVAANGLVAVVLRALTQCQLPTTMPPSLDAPELVDRMRGDKKSRNGALVFSLPKQVGAMAGEESQYLTTVSKDVVLSALTEFSRPHAART